MLRFLSCYLRCIIKALAIKLIFFFLKITILLDLIIKKCDWQDYSL